MAPKGGDEGLSCIQQVGNERAFVPANGPLGSIKENSPGVMREGNISDLMDQIYHLRPIWAYEGAEPPDVCMSSNFSTVPPA